MIENIKGIVEKKTPAYVVMNANGIGIKISMSINGLEAVPPKGNDAIILTYLHVREDMLDLYGFATERERHTFMQLINISGIGPKLALTILSGINPDKLKDRVVAGDVASLTSVPGVGAKTAKRIIVELKEKFVKMDEDSLGFEEEDTVESILFRDALNALISLGYKSRYARKVLQDLDKNGELRGELESVIKKALSQLVS
ncbi:MAG: Holliday junction branch migration protein RuvA [Candidatus Neomarinimicrobiota bacterium]|nr:Holliday junction branch migration protein RuvA [Candidatus Neomarinimicrobiota bacterium]